MDGLQAVQVERRRLRMVAEFGRPGADQLGLDTCELGCVPDPEPVPQDASARVDVRVAAHT